MGGVQGTKLAVLAGAWLLLQSWAALAEPEPEPFRLLYTSVTGCPDERTFIDWVVTKNDRARPAKPGEHGRTFVVSLHSDQGKIRGSLALVGPDGVTEEREITADTCEHAARAMSLIMALALDPRSREASEANPAAQPVRPRPKPRGQDSARRRPPATTKAPARSTEASADRIVAGVGPEWWAGVAPGMPTALTAFAEARLLPSTTGTVTLGISRTSVTEQLGAAVFTFGGARFEACQWLVESTVRLGPCAGAAGGLVVARGDDRDGQSELVVTQRRIEPWVEPVLLARAGWLPVRWAELRLLAGVGVPLYRPRYYFQEGSAKPVFYAVPAVVGGVGLGAGLTFR